MSKKDEVAVQSGKLKDISSSEIEKTQKKLAQLLQRQYDAQEGIKREGKEFVIPEYMTYEDARKTLDEHIKNREEQVEKTLRFNCHPNDGLVCFSRAMKKTFGNILGASQEFTFFIFHWTVPGQTVAVPIGFNETETVPVGAIKVPGLPIEVEVSFKENKTDPMDGWVYITLKYQRKYEPLIKDIESLTHEEMRERSIFKNKAIDSQFQFIDLSMDLSRVVYSQHEGRQLDANVFHVIEDTEGTVRAGIPLKRTILFHGRYGTGKTLTALKAAQQCVRYGWTFMNVRPGDDISQALKFGRKFEPCLIFFEDIDSVTAGDRDEALNQVLNTIDGILSKNARVMTILTTNHIDKISKGMLRPGRIDEVIQLGDLDQQAVVDLVRAYSEGMLEGELDGPALMRAAEGYVPAFVVEAVHKAKAYALAAGQNAETLMVTSRDVEDALHGLRDQFNLMMGKQTTEKPRLDSALIEAVRPLMVEEFESFTQKLNPRVLRDD